MRIHVAFTPSEAVTAPVCVVVDVLRASTIAQALAMGYRRVFCCAEIDTGHRASRTTSPGVHARASWMRSRGSWA